MSEKLYPIYYNGKKLYKKDCDDLFTVYYCCKDAINSFGAVYLSDDTWIYPDGTISSDDMGGGGNNINSLNTNVNIDRVQPLVNRLWKCMQIENPNGYQSLEIYEMLLYGWAGKEDELEKRVIEKEKIIAQQIIQEKEKIDSFLDGCLTVDEWEKKHGEKYWGRP
jgi:hypothetical protein